MAVQDNDLGLKRIIRDLEDLCEYELKVGVQGDSGTSSNDANIVDVAVWNEFGTEHIPQRPFLRDTCEEKDDWGDKKANIWNSVIDGLNPRTAMEILGQQAKGDIQEKIGSGDFTPNAPSTIKKKGSSTPLIDTGQLRQSITFKLTKGGED